MCKVNVLWEVFIANIILPKQVSQEFSHKTLQGIWKQTGKTAVKLYIYEI